MNNAEAPIELAYAVERDVDLGLVQTLYSSSSFREWFADELGVGAIATVQSIKHSVMTETGESDVELWFEDDDGATVAILIENKIDAAFQDRQLERYVERGEEYVASAACDSFSVVLFAPRDYISGVASDGVDAMVSYERVRTHLQSTHPEEYGFFSALLGEALEKPKPTDHSELTREIAERFVARTSHRTDVEVVSVTPTQVIVESNAPDHPPRVSYKVYVPGKFEGERAIARVEIDGDASETEREELQETLTEHVDGLDGFEATGNIMDAVKSDLFRDHYDTESAYLAATAGALAEVIEFYHPKLAS